MKDALLEIGSEELPAAFIGMGLAQLKTLAETTLAASGLTYQSIETFGTPRRLAILIHQLADRSPYQTKIVTGPPAAAAKDAQGQWTAAALGFARKQGLKPSDLKIENDRLTAVLHLKGALTRQLLSDLFPQWIAKLEFPKAMVWEPSKFRYPRPLRWIAAFYGGDPVSFQLAGIRSGRWSFGLGGQSPKKVPLPSPAKYAAALKNQCVLADPVARQDSIRRQIEQAARRVQGKPVASPSLVDQVANLVEHPVAVLGGFDPSYLELPSEVLITCLEHHQRFFPMAHERTGKLLSHFVGIRNGVSVHQETVREGYERVLAARLADAKFFFAQDRRQPLASRVDALQRVVLQEKLGTLYDKKERVKSLARWIARAAALPADTLQKAERAADLCKADLVTDIVREFPELQGVTARIYALLDGEDPVVSSALEQHYWPITLTSPLPKTDVAALLAVADKIDTLAGDFAIGLIPSGSADPYGLRRAAVGILRILEERKWTVDINLLVAEALQMQPGAASGPAADAARPKLTGFLRQRLSAVLEERGSRVDEIEAILEAGFGDLPDALSRLAALQTVRRGADFEALSIAFKRAANIVRQSQKSGHAGDGSEVQELLLKESEEVALFRTLVQVEAEVRAHAERKTYPDALGALAPLKAPLDAFFTKVMVMAEDPALRANRLALMRRLVAAFSRIADFSKLQNA